MNEKNILIEVAYATPDKQLIVELQVVDGTFVLDAILQSKISTYFPKDSLVDLDESSPVGIFGKKIDLKTYKLQDMDRIEIYRPLNKTPNQKRLDRAKGK
jgi:uncharacterized protein